jgi:hypothetical protein
MECPYRNAGSHHPRSRWPAPSTHYAIHRCIGQDEETVADAVKTDDESTHKDLSIESRVFCALDISATSIIRCAIKLAIAFGHSL